MVILLLRVADELTVLEQEEREVLEAQLQAELPQFKELGEIAGLLAELLLLLTVVEAEEERELPAEVERAEVEEDLEAREAREVGQVLPPQVELVERP
jgi:hypothetical protein